MSFFTRKEDFLPLSQADTDRLSININLPYGLSEHIGINTRFAHALLQIGGIRHAHVEGKRGLSTSSTKPQLASVNSRGEAVAGQSVADEVPTSFYQTTSDRLTVKKQSRWADVHLQLNLDEIQGQIFSARENIQSAESWAPRINLAIRKALLGAGTDYLVNHLNNFDKFKIITFYSVTFLILLSFEGLTQNAFKMPHILFGMSAGNLVNFLGDIATDGIEHSGKGRRFSLLYGEEIDRAIVLHLVGRLGTLVSVIPHEASIPPQD